MFQEDRLEATGLRYFGKLQRLKASSADCPGCADPQPDRNIITKSYTPSLRLEKYWVSNRMTTYILCEAPRDLLKLIPKALAFSLLD